MKIKPLSEPYREAAGDIRQSLAGAKRAVQIMRAISHPDRLRAIDQTLEAMQILAEVHQGLEQHAQAAELAEFIRFTQEGPRRG